MTATSGLSRSAQSWIAFGIALAHQEHDRAGVGRGIVGQPLLPVGGEQATFGQRVDIGGQRQRHDIGLQPIQHRAGLRTGAAMRLVDGDALPGLALPVGDEGAVDVAVQFACRIVGDIQQRRFGGRGATDGDAPPSRMPMAVRRDVYACRIDQLHCRAIDNIAAVGCSACVRRRVQRPQRGAPAQRDQQRQRDADVRSTASRSARSRCGRSARRRRAVRSAGRRSPACACPSRGRDTRRRRAAAAPTSAPG